MSIITKVNKNRRIKTNKNYAFIITLEKTLLKTQISNLQLSCTVSLSKLTKRDSFVRAKFKTTQSMNTKYMKMYLFSI